MSPTDVLDKALSGERITDDDALTLLRSRDLVAVGRAADELRNRKLDRRRVTFIIDRNVNYTNVCYTDCDFCAFYRRPGDTREGYLLPKAVIFKKIEETLEPEAPPPAGRPPSGSRRRVLRGPLQLDQGALPRPPARALPLGDPARRSSLQVHHPAGAHAPSRRGARLASGRRRRDLVDRVRNIISPKKTTTAEWLGIMREAQRIGMSTTATMMYGHVETLEERVEHMRRIREPGRDARVPRLHLLDVPARRQPAFRAGA